MKKIIIYALFLFTISIVSKKAEATTIRGAVSFISPPAGADYAFKCNGLAGTCCQGDIWVGGTIQVTGLPGDWVIVEIYKPNNEDEDDDNEFSIKQGDVMPVN